MKRTRSKRKTSSPYASGSPSTSAKRTSDRSDANQDSNPQLTPGQSSSMQGMGHQVPSNLASSGPNDMQGTCTMSDTQVQCTMTANENITNITQITSAHAKLGLHVSETHKSKIKNGEYMDIASLLDSKCLQSSEKSLVLINGVISTKEKKHEAINTIEKWTDAFIIYMSIYLSTHPEKCQELLKYVSTVRLGASRIKGLGWKEYDEQFRLKMAMDPSKPWDIVDQELWLIYMSNTNTNTSTSYVNKTAVNKCYNFNYKGVCDRNPCLYQHVCFNCSERHPFYFCNNGSNQTAQPIPENVSLNQPFRFRGQGFSQRFPRPNIARNQNTSSGQRFMGPRVFSHQNRHTY